MIANLPWYDFPEIREHTNAFWSAVARNLVERGHKAPTALDRLADFDEQWRSPELFFSQACGYDVALSNRQYLHVVATPRYSAPGCEGSCYRSFVVVRAESRYTDLSDTRGAGFIANSPNSHSGMSSIRDLIAPMHRGGRFFGSVRFSGSHEKSLEMVQTGLADLAAIDCVTYAILSSRRSAALQNLRILCQTQAVPAPPFVTSRLAPAAVHAALRESLLQLFEDSSTGPIRNALLLNGLDFLPESAYDAIALMEQKSVRIGYREMPFFVK